MWQFNGNNTYYNTGTVAIGTTAAGSGETFRVTGRSRVNGLDINQWNGQTIVTNYLGELTFSNAVAGKSVRFYARDNGGYNTFFQLDGSEETIKFFTESSERFRVNKDGSVGIGTSSVPSGYSLAVGGDVICEKVKVQVEAEWIPDYVFKPDYELLDLKALSAYIKKHGHLPDIASAEEMEKEGLDLARMDAKLLQKIEELTLYLLEKEEEVKVLQANQASLESRLRALESKLLD